MADTKHDGHDVIEPASDHGHEVEHHRPVDRPEDWGWHAEAGKLARAGGWISVVVLLLMNIGNQTRHTENIWLTGVAALLVVILLYDRHRRKNSWRDR